MHFRALRDIELEDVDEMRSQNRLDMGQNINSTSKAKEAVKEVKEKKKKHKDAEKSKKKKHKIKNGERISEIENEGQNGTSENINLWLEDVNAQTITPNELNCNNENGVSSKAKKGKKKHKKQSKDKKKERFSEVSPSKPPKKQCLVDSNDVKLDCYLEAADNDSDDHNVIVTFLCENTHNEFPLNEVEIKLEGGQQVSVVGSNPIRSNILPQSIQNEHCCLKVSYKLG